MWSSLGYGPVQFASDQHLDSIGLTLQTDNGRTDGWPENIVLPLLTLFT